MQQKDVTELLVAWSRGDREAIGELMPLVYGELHHLAGRYLSRERRYHTLQTTALVHEAFLRLVDQQRVSWQNRTHFFAIAAQMMRRILVSHARNHQAVKRGGGDFKITLSEELGLFTPPAQQKDLDIAALDDALNRLAAKDERKSRIVELRYFGGLSVEETAEVLGLSPGTVKREWRMARALLYCEFGKSK